MVVTSNDREFDCETTDERCYSSAARSDDGRPFAGNVVAMDARVLDTDALRADLDRMAVTLASSVDEYKRWLESRESEFELRYLANDFTRDISLFNRLNGVVSRVRQARKRLNGWYSRMQELLANALDQLGTYSESVAVIQSYAQPDFTNFGVAGGGISFLSPLAQAKRNVSKVRSVQRHLNTLALTESRLKTTVITLRTQLEMFSRGVVRHDGKLLDLAEVGKLVSELMGGDTPLLRVQQQLADTINATRASVRVTSVPPGAPFNSDIGGGSGGEGGRFSAAGGGADANEADAILERLRAIAETTLYTNSTQQNIEGIARLAHARINEHDTVRRGQLDELLSEIRSNTPIAVINRYGQQARRSDGVFLRVKQLNLLIANLQPADRELYEAQLREIYDETYEEAQRTVDHATPRRATLRDDDNEGGAYDLMDETYDDNVSFGAMSDREEAEDERR